MFDGKKIIPQSAEVYLLDTGDEPKISTMKSEYDDKLTCITKFIEQLETFQLKEIQAEDRSEFYSKLMKQV